MKSMLRLSPQLTMPLKVTTERLAWLGNSGSGKSYKCSVFVEELLENKQQVVIVDPQGGWHGLRSSADGKGPGFPILIMGGEHGDVPLDPASGTVVADLIIEQGISVILDLSLFEEDEEEAQFMTAFCDRLFRKNRHAMHLVLDEGDNFAPQNPEKYQVKMLGRVKRIAKRGRFKGIGLSVIFQRASELHKSVLSQIQILIATQTTSPLDRTVIKDWVRGKADEDEQKMVFSTIASIPTEKAWVWSPKLLEIMKLVKFRDRKTFDSTATPAVGVRVREPKVLAPVDIEILKKHMAEAVEKAKSEDPTLLREELKKMRGELASSKAKVEELEAELGSAEAETLELQEAQKKRKPAQAKIQPVAVIKAAQILALSREVKALGKAAKQLSVMNQIAHKVNEGNQALHNRIADLNILIDKAKNVTINASAPAPVQPLIKLAPPTLVARILKQIPAILPTDSKIQALRAGERKLLCTAARFFPTWATNNQIGTLIGFPATGPTYPTYFNRLKRLGYIVAGDGGLVIVTNEGLGVAKGLADSKDLAMPTTTEELVKLWGKSLRKGERIMLEWLVGSYPNQVGVQGLADNCHIKSPETVTTYVNTLKRNQLAVEIEKNVIRASDHLFPNRRARA